MTDDLESFIVTVTDAHGGDIFTGTFRAATYHRALRVAWSETTDDRPLSVTKDAERHSPVSVLVP
jgi:hypothetical protein